MKGITTVPLPNDLGDLKRLPHVMAQFIDMLTGEQQLPATEQEQRWQHLEQCIHCQAFLASYLVKLIEYDKAHGEPEEPAQGLLDQLTQIMHETLKEDIPAYVEALAEYGEEEAGRSFALFTGHLHTCRDCQMAVQDLRAWLDQL